MNYDELAVLKRAAEQALEPMKQWSKRCHEASCALVMSGALSGARVARGACRMVPGQHSWVTLGDPYADDVIIFDPTLWSYTNVVPEVWVGERKRWRHRPHGVGSIYEWGRPPEVSDKEAYVLKPPKGGWSVFAAGFLEQLGPISLEGWRILAHAPVQGWPATEILTQMRKDSKIGGYIPIDIAGMVCGEVSEIYPRCPR